MSGLGFLHQLSLPRLLAVCAALVLTGAGATAIASALTTSDPPPPEPLAVAVHDALAAAPVQGVSAQIQYTNHLFEGANLAGGGGSSSSPLSSPLLTGASGRLWIAQDGRIRIELQSSDGDTEVLIDQRVISALIPSSRGLVLYRFTLRDDHAGSSGPAATQPGSPPSRAQIEADLAHLERHAIVSAAQPGNVAGRPTYTVRLSPREGGSLLGGLALSWDAAYGVPLRGAIYAAGKSAPVVELSATEVSYGPVQQSVFELSPPSGTKVIEPQREGDREAADAGSGRQAPKVRAIGHGVTSILELDAPSDRASATNGSELAGTRKVTVNGAVGHELETALGTVLSFERNGVSHLLLGAVKPIDIAKAAEGR